MTLPDATPARNTRQRGAILGALREADRPLTPLEIRAMAGTKAAGLGLATVYRALRRLVEDGVIVPVSVPGEPPRYEVGGKEHHHHFSCRTCGGLFEVRGCPPGLAALAPPGFEVEGHEVVMYGRCRDCRTSEKQ